MSKKQDIDKILRHCLDLVVNQQYTIDEVLGNYPELADQLRPELEALVWLQKKGRVFDPRPEFVANSKQRVLNLIKQEQRKAETSVLSRKPFFRLFSFRIKWQMIAALAVLIFLLFVGNRTIVATYHSIPGQTLYPVKLFVEQLQVAFPPNSQRTAQLYVEFVYRRQAEIEALILEGHFDFLSEGMRNYREAVDQAVSALDRLAEKDPALVNALAISLNDALSSQIAFLNVVAEAIPPQYRLEYDQMIEYMMESSVAVQNLLVGKVSPSSWTGTPTLAVGTQTATLTSTPTTSSTTTQTPTRTTTPTKTPTGTRTFTPTKTLKLLPTSTAKSPPGSGGNRTNTPTISIGPATSTPTPASTPTPSRTPNPPTTTPTQPTPTRTPTRNPYP